MKLNMILAGCLLLSIGLFPSAQEVSAQDAPSMSPAEYETEMARWQSRETAASSEASRLDRDIESLKKQIADIDETISLERRAIFGLRTASDDEIREYMNMLKDLELDVANLDNLSKEELSGDVELLEDIELRLESLSENDLAALEQNRNLLSDIDNMLSNYRTVIPEPTQEDIETLASNEADSLSEEDAEEAAGKPETLASGVSESGDSKDTDDTMASADEETSAEEKANEDEADAAEKSEVDTIGEEELAEVMTDGEVPKVVQFDRKADSYRVIRGDNLWKISGKELIYNDPLQWLKIYSANREQISNPDVIEIDQVFVIPRTPALNEHWVSRGESLSKIAAKKYANPFEWTKIYQANKTILESPDLIHPHTILIIPKKDKKKDESPVNM